MGYIQLMERLHCFLKLLHTRALQSLDRFTSDVEDFCNLHHLKTGQLKTYDFLSATRQVCDFIFKTEI